MKTEALLKQMHDENRADHADMVTRMDAGFESVNTALRSHAREDDRRFSDIRLELQPLTELRRGVTWAKRTLYGGAGVALLVEAIHILTKGY